MIDFTDLDDLSGSKSSPVSVSSTVPHSISEVQGAGRQAAASAPLVYTEICRKCGGSGRYNGFSQYGRECFACKGKGAKQFKTSPEARAKAKMAAVTRKNEAKRNNLAAFEAANPDIAAWWKDSDFDFAVSLRTAVTKYGSLSERQLSAAKSCIEKLAAAQAPVVNVEHIKDALMRAKSKGIKWPKMLLAGDQTQFVFSLAGDNSRNPGSVYVKTDGDVYAGKIDSGKFFRSRECSESVESEVISVCSDPEQSLTASGSGFAPAAVAS